MTNSPFRRMFGREAKREQCYEDVKFSKSPCDSPLCAVNPKFLAVCIEPFGEGSFLVLPLEKVGRLEVDTPKVCGHSSTVLNVAWNPFNDNIIASSSEDTEVMIWEIPDGGLKEQDLTEPSMVLSNHERKVGIIQWHPTAEHILLSASHDNRICIWNLNTGSCEVEIDCHPDLIFCVNWNYNGSLIATTCKDKQLRIINPRTGEVMKQSPGHEGAKPQRITFCGETDTLFTTGFSKMSQRQYAMWSNDLEQKIQDDIDDSRGVQLIEYDPDINLVWLIGKGDSFIRCYEVKLGTVSSPTYECSFLNNYAPSRVAQKGFAFMPKRGCNIRKNEVAKIYRATATAVIPISFTVPSKTDVFQTELFPNTRSGEPSLMAKQWFEGKDAPSKLIPCELLYHGITGIRRNEVVDVPKLLETIETLTQNVAETEATNAKLREKITELQNFLVVLKMED